MKRTLLALFFALFFLGSYSSLQAQFGIRLGGHLAKQEIKSNAVNFSFKTRVGLDIGLLFGIPVSEGFALQPEIHFVQKGYKINDIVLGEDVLSTLNYIEVPLTAKILFGDETNLFFQAGPTIGYMLSGNLKQDDIKEELDLEEISRLEIGGLISAGINLGPIAIDARYLLGFTDTLKDVANGNVFNRGFGAGVSILF